MTEKRSCIICGKEIQSSDPEVVFCPEHVGPAQTEESTAQPQETTWEAEEKAFQQMTDIPVKRQTGETLLETNDKFRINCSICGKAITELANSDGRAVELGEEITYWCETCAWQQDVRNYSYREDEWGYIHLPGCWHSVTGRAVDCKTIWFSENKGVYQVELQRDMKKLASISHPHTSQIIDYHIKEDSMTIISAYYLGNNLRDYIKHLDGKSIPCRDAVRAVLDLLTGLAEIQRLDDGLGRVNPGAIRVVNNNLTQTRLCLADFYPPYFYNWEDPEDYFPIGLNFEIGHFLAPQRHQEPLRVEPAWDLFSLGQILYLMLAGKVSYEPLAGEEKYFRQLRSMFKSDPVPIQDRESCLPLPVARMVDKAVALESENRFQNIDEFRTMLQGVLEEI